MAIFNPRKENANQSIKWVKFDDKGKILWNNQFYAQMEESANYWSHDDSRVVLLKYNLGPVHVLIATTTLT